MAMPNTMKAFAGVAMLGALAACQGDISADTYAVGSVGQVNRTVRGTILAARLVNISGSQSGLGVATGAAAGGIGGSAFGHNSGNAAAVLAGVVIGGVVGAVAEEAATRQTGVEYIVQTENGALVTLVQGPEPAFVINQKVLVIYGVRARIAADPTM
jgi:outer membrane lipoprotein SlyB